MAANAIPLRFGDAVLTLLWLDLAVRLVLAASHLGA